MIDKYELPREWIKELTKEESYELPREWIKELTKEESESLQEVAVNNIANYAAENPDDAANLILEMIMKLSPHPIDSLLDWSDAYQYDDEGVKTILGFWPWKADPIPATEVCDEVRTEED